MNTIVTLIENERAKIKLLRAKIEECERRIATLQSMVDDDDLDALLARRVEVAGASAVSKDASVPVEKRPRDESGPSSDEERFPKKPLHEKSLKMLQFAGKNDKSIDQFLEHARTNGVTDSRQRVRAFLHHFKSVHKLLVSDRDGYFRLSDLGVAYLEYLSSSGGANSAA